MLLMKLSFSTLFAREAEVAQWKIDRALLGRLVSSPLQLSFVPVIYSRQTAIVLFGQKCLDPHISTHHGGRI